MGFWGKLFGTDEALKAGAKAVSEATTGIISGIDAAFYTNEEKAKDIKDMVFKLQDQYTPRSMSRRILAVILTGVFSIFALTALVFACLKQYDVSKAIIDVANAFSIGTIMVTVIVFYFGYYGIQQVFNKDKKS